METRGRSGWIRVPHLGPARDPRPPASREPWSRSNPAPRPRAPQHIPIAEQATPRPRERGVTIGWNAVDDFGTIRARCSDTPIMVVLADVDDRQPLQVGQRVVFTI